MGNYILALRSSSLTQRRDSLLNLHLRLKELRLQASWIPSKDSQGPGESLKNLQAHEPFFQALTNCLKFKETHKGALQCLTQLGGDRASKVLFLLAKKKKKNRPYLTALLKMDPASQPYLLMLLQLRKAGDFEEQILQQVSENPSKEALTQLLELLKGPGGISPKLLQKALLACGDRILKPLKKLALSPSKSSGWKALLLLGRTGKEEGVNFLIDHFSQDIPLVEKGICLQALGESRDPKAEEFFLKLASQKDFPKELGKVLMYGLGMGKSPSGEELLLKTAQGKNSLGLHEETRLFALQALGQRKCQKALPLFLALLDQKDPRMILKGLYGLGQIKAFSARKRLEKLYGEVSHPKLKYQILYVLGELADHSSADFFIRCYSKDLPLGLKNLILHNLTRFPSLQREKCLKKFLEEKEEVLRYRARIYLKRKNPKMLRESLLNLLSSSEEKVALESAEPLLELDLEGVPLSEKQSLSLVRLLFQNQENSSLIKLMGLLKVSQGLSLLERIYQRKENHKSLRKEALFALGRLGTSEAFSVLKGALQSREEPVIQAALEALGWVQKQEALNLLQRALPDSEKRRAALLGLSRRPKEQTAKIFLEILLDPKNSSEEGKIAGAFFLRLGEDGKAAAYQLLLGPPQARFIASQILTQWGNRFDIQKLRRLSLKAPRTRDQIINNLLLYEEGRAFRSSERGQEILKFLGELQQGNSKVFFTSFFPHPFHLLQRKYMKLKDMVPELRKYLGSLKLQRVYLLKISTFHRYTGLFRKALPSELKGNEIVLFERHSAKILVLKRDGQRWKIWGGV